MRRYKPTTKEELQKLCEDRSIYLGDIDTSLITDMSYLFYENTRSNEEFEGIESWDVSNVENMQGMFYTANSFNQPINSWNVSKVKNMSYMFSGFPERFWEDEIIAFNQPLHSWDVGNVENMSHMFAGAKFFNQPLDSWDVSKVEDMSSMFEYAESFNQPLDSWNVSKVKSMEGMFHIAQSFNQPIDFWNVSNVENMSYMFAGAQSFNQPLHSWDVSKVEDMSHMFENARSFNQIINHWNVSQVTNMEGMFKKTFFFNQPLHCWNVKKVKSFKEIFAGAKAFCHSLASWDIQSVLYYVEFGTLPTHLLPPALFQKPIVPTNTQELREFVNDTRLSLENINTHLITDMRGLFANCKREDLSGIEKWNVSKVKDMSYMFSGLQSINVSFEKWDIGSLEYSHKILPTHLLEQNLFSPHAPTPPPPYKPTTKRELKALIACKDIPLGSIDTSLITDMSFLFLFTGRSEFEGIGSWDVSQVENMRGMFAELEGFNEPLERWDVSNVKDMSRMFLNAISFNQSLTCWNAKSLQKNELMFCGADCYRGEEIPLAIV